MNKKRLEVKQLILLVVYELCCLRILFAEELCLFLKYIVEKGRINRV